MKNGMKSIIGESALDCDVQMFSLHDPLALGETQVTTVMGPCSEAPLEKRIWDGFFLCACMGVL